MASVTICQATPGKLYRKKTVIGTVVELRTEAGQLTSLPENRFRLVWQGIILEDDFDVTRLANGLVMVVPMAEPRQAAAPKPEPVIMSEQDVQRFRLAFVSAIKNPVFSKVVRRMVLRENMDSVAATCPGLQEDYVAQGYLTRPELLYHLLDPDTLKKVAEKHPSLLEAAYNLAAAVHEEQASANRGASAAEPEEHAPGNYFLDEMSDDDIEEDDEGPRGRGAGPRGPRITSEQLAAAIAAATGVGGSNPFMGVTGLAPPSAAGSGSAPQSGSHSTVTTPGAARITADLFQAALQQALLGIGGTGPSAVNPGPTAPVLDFSAQLATMRDMGIVDEGLAVRALQEMGGDIQAAVDLIFSGWLGGDEAMQ